MVGSVDLMMKLITFRFRLVSVTLQPYLDPERGSSRTLTLFCLGPSTVLAGVGIEFGVKSIMTVEVIGMIAFHIDRVPGKIHS